MIDLKANSEYIDDLVKMQYPWNDSLEIGPILDGIINIDQYKLAKYRILWILKEPYDKQNENGNPCGGGWDLRIILNEKKSIKDFGREKMTFKPMIYVSYGILNNFCTWDEMPEVEESKVFETLKSIAYFNIKKLPGFTASPSSVISNAYELNKKILIQQIKLYSPQIIIGGGIMDYFLPDLQIDRNKRVIRKEGSFPYYIKDKQLFISAYHPSSVPRILPEKNYCDDLISTVKSVSEIWNS
jgi:hypothetical protein